MRYIKQPASGELHSSYGQEPPEGADKAKLEFDERNITVTDIRAAANTFTLERQGFVLKKLEVPKDVDWDNTEEASYVIGGLSRVCLKEQEASILASKLLAFCGWARVSREQ